MEIEPKYFRVVLYDEPDDLFGRCAASRVGAGSCLTTIMLASLERPIFREQNPSFIVSFLHQG